MFDHVKFGVSDYAASKAFFLKALEPLGVAVVSEGPPTYGVELSPKGKASLCLYQTEEKPAHLHLAFTAENRRQVEAFYRAALEAGGKDNGAPGLRPHYHANYYAAFVIGPDGHNIEVVCHEPESATAPDRNSPRTTRAASCSCGQLSAITSADPLRISVCHCLACQRRTGSVFGAQARFPASSVTVRGASKQFVRVGDAGSRTRFNFCPNCGATVYYTIEGGEDNIAIPVGAFAEPSFPGPSVSVYEERMHSWVQMPKDIGRVA